jgi:phosphate transport system substrate-binding protein
VLAEGCKMHPSIMALDCAKQRSACRHLRDDGKVVPGAKRENEVIEWLRTHPGAYAVTSFGILMKAGGRISASAIEGVEPTPETLASARFPLTTTLYVYVKDRHLRPIPSLQQFVYELTSERAIAPDGYLSELGLVPLDEISRNRARDQALSLGLR